MMPWIALSYAHGEAELAHTEQALRSALGVYAKALEDGYQRYLTGHEIKPVFRKFN
jgi:glutamate-1-semialdehyde 2,1-aminomutase